MRLPARVEIEELTSARKKLERLVAEELPSAKLLDISIRAEEDYTGEEILNVQIVLDTVLTTRDEIARQIEVSHKFGAWLIQEYGDERFPFVDFIGKTEIEERRRAYLG